MVGVHVPPSLPVPHSAAPDAFPQIRLPKHIAHPDFAPILAAAAELDVALGVHGSPGVYLPSGIAEQVDSFILSHIFGHRNQMQMALSACVFEGVFDRHPALRAGFLEGGCGWVADLVHAYHEHWEKRIRDFDPDVKVPPGQFARELFRERVRSDRKRHVLRKVKHAYGLYRRSQKDAAAVDRTAFIHEHPNLTHDPVDFFRSGRIFLSFESDDPAPSYLKAALGTIGEDIACFSADYGHWDGVLTDCVENVVKAADYERAHLAKLLAGNCLRLYGRRLEDALVRHGTLPRPAGAAAVPSSAA
jgi:predicted TIM-barrel fold metal-dependent hydrolase